MEIMIKDKLRTLRQQKNITQETLATHLGITPQSVGKWERGEGFPDITLLPKLALYFDVTVDELLCVDRARIDETIEGYIAESKVYKHTGENAKNLALWEKAYAEFPNDCRVMLQLMYAINRDGEYPCPPEKAERIITLGEAILQKSTDTKQREDVIQVLCYTCKGLDKEKALHYADMGGSFYVTREDLRSHVLEGEEGVKQCQEYLMSLIHSAAMTATQMTTKGNFSRKETIDAHQFSIDILKCLFSDGNVGFYANYISQHYRCIALLYAELGDAAHTLEALKENCYYSVTEATLGDMNYTAPMINRVQHKHADTSKNYTGNCCNISLKTLEAKRFDFVRDTEDFQKMMTELRRYAE
ncbi:MAG: helix-turn-helix transcriptional regulator [Lachnospiraceae bacterium]|nr:helix-turn-helix transcriptional regulator [Lachnospiraceae bacterium]